MSLRSITGNRSDQSQINCEPSWDQERGFDADAGAPELNLTQAIFGHKLLLIFLAVVGSILGYLQYLNTPPVYASFARLRLVHTAPVLGIDGFHDRLASRSPIDTQVVLMTSPLVLDRAVKKLQNDESGKRVQHHAASISSGLSVVHSSNSDEIVDLRYRGRDPDECREILNAVFAAYIDYLNESQGTSAQKMFELISEAKDDLLDDLSEKEAAYAQFRNNASLLWSGDSGKNLHAERLSGIESQRAQVMLERAMMESQLHSVQALLERGENREAIMLMIDQLGRKKVDSTHEVTFSGASVPRSQELMPLLLEEQLLQERFGPGHPKIKEIQKRIEVSRALLQSHVPDIESPSVKPRTDILQVYVDSLKHEIETHNEKLSKLNALFRNEEISAKRLSIEENQSRALQDNLGRTKQLFETVLTKLQSMELNKDTATLSAEPVVLPKTGEKVAPSMTKNVAIGGAVGAILAIAIAVLIEMSDRSYRTPDEISRHLNVPVIGHVPNFILGKIKPQQSGNSIDPSVVSFHRPHSEITESYRTIRTALMLGMSTDKRIIQITSPNPSDGKSTLTSNLAVTFANSGKRCLLLDCDLRRPKIHKLFDVPNKAGLSSVILQSIELENAIQATAIENLDLLTSGPRTKNPSELFLTRQFTHVMEFLRDRYDIVFIDSAPILAVSESASVASMVDGVLVVTRVGRNSRPWMSRVQTSLSLVGANVLGVVVNGIGGARSTYGGSYSKYSPYYGYHYHGAYGKYSQYHDETSDPIAPPQKV